MAPLPANTEATPPLPSLAHPSPPARSYPSHPHQTMWGIPEESMAPSPATTEAATPSPSSAHPFLPTRSSPTHPLPTMGGSAALAASRALKHSIQRMAFTMSNCPGFADANPWVMEDINTVARALQCWYQRHSIRLYLARQTRQRLAATTIQCWKRASGLIAGSPSRPYSTRNTSACSCCVVAHRRTPCRFGVITNHLPPRPTKPLTQRSSVIPS
jgi:hypothetical protein